MRRKSSFWFLLSLLCVAGAYYYFWQAERRNAEKAGRLSSANQAATHHAKAKSASSNSVPLIAKKSGAATSTNAAALAAAAKKRFPYRLSNTDQTPGQLVHNERAVLLANALIDTTKPLNVAIPDRLRAPADNGSYVVQAKGVVNDQFRALLQDANATIVSYIPNNAFLVRVSAEGAQQIAADARTQGVLPYEPYYKLDTSLLKLAMEHPEQLPPNGRLNLTLFPDGSDRTLEQLRGLGAQVLAQERSPFGPVVTVMPVAGTLSAIASVPGVQGVASAHGRVQANDLDRVRLNVAANSLGTTSDYLGLTGTNVLVSINDGGVDATQPDLINRVVTVSSNAPNFALIATNALTDWSGHGTHVAGTILGTGLESTTVPTTPPGSAKNANFRGMAPNATAFVLPIFAGTNFYFSLSDSYLQEQPALTNALISNNSWNYGGAHGYDIQAASYDAAVRDALPEVMGSQPVLFVFSAGNDGGGYDDGTGGSSDSILSPATAKNVITVGAIEQQRFITNEVVVDGVTNNEMYTATDNGTQVASFSSRGNVGINVEGDYGRFKPDLVAPGTFVISDRSGQWDTNSYYNPTNYSFYYYTSNLVTTNATNSFLFPVPIGAIGMIITLQTNALTDYTNMPPLPIYLGVNNFPSDTPPPTGTNVVTLPITNGSPNIPLNGGDTIYFDVINTWTNAVNYDVQIEVLTTNDVGNYYLVLSNMNNALGSYYRYESGTSMAAAGVSGMLALMQEFFQQRMHVTNSPALMKALLINGARSLSDQYDMAVANPNQPTFQGWGLPSLPNCIPPAISNLTSGDLSQKPLQFFDQNPTNALATGQSQTRNVTLSGDALLRDLRITLVWTDPPGSPQAGIKLVNDLDLIVSNTATGEVFYGNDIPSGSSYNQAWDTNSAPNIDSVNNVENVYLSAPAGTNFTVTVLGRRVNVNAVTATTNGIVQDYALVISSGDASSTGGLAVSDANSGAIITNNIVSNVFVLSNNVPMLNQRVGANSQFSGSTNGTASQWNFYIYTNTAAASNSTFTNVAFVTFQPPNLGVPRMGASTEVAPPDLNATRYAGADIDLYVSTNSALTNLDPLAIAGSSKALGRLGSEVVYFTNSTASQVYYIGVKSEDQQAAQFNLIGFATDIPFSQQNGSNGPTVVNMNPVPLTIPGGTPTSPQSTFLIGICVNPMQVRKVVVSNTVTCQDFGDYIGSLSEGQSSAVLNNHSFFTNVNDVTETLVYDDSGEGEFPGALKSAGPGSLRNFVGINALGSAWTYTIVNDSSPTDSGSISNMTLLLEPQPPANSGLNRLPFLDTNSWYYGFVDVPANATNLTISIVGNTGPIELFIQNGSVPSFASFQKSTNITSAGGSLSISKYDLPPLNAGRYYFAVYSENTAEANLSLGIELDYSLAGNTALTFISNTNQILLDDAVNYSTNHVSNDSAVVSAEVGVRIQHPRESDLVLTLVSPQGTRVLLAENRGGTDTNGYGSGTNYVLGFAATSGGASTFSTNINVGANVGVVNISYNFYTIPDEMAIYYDGARIYDTGMISGQGNIVVPFGPGNSQNVTITMNPYGNDAGTNGDQWDFNATITAQNLSYIVFTEDTNMTTTPIKFAVPPFGAGAAYIPAQTVVSNSFEGIAASAYPATIPAADSNSIAWTVTTPSNATPPMVVTVPNFAYDGSNVLALHGGTISGTLPTVAGRKYTLTFANHGRPVPTPLSWWKAEGNTLDSVDGNSLYDVSTNDAVVYTNGVAGQAFLLDGNVQLRAPDATNLYLTNALTVEGWVNPLSNTNTGVILQRGADGNYNPYTLSVGPSSTNSGGLDLQWQIMDTNGNSASITAPLAANVFSHVAATYSFDGTNGSLTLYVNGQQMTNLLVTNLQPIGAIGITLEPGLSLGNVGSPTNYMGFIGLLDEFAIYTNELSVTNVQDIYAAGSAGKDLFNLSEPVTAQVIFGGTTNTILGNDEWDTQVYSFVAPSNSMTLTFAANDDGMLLDAIQLVQDSMPNPANYYLPEESLAKLAGESSLGDWQLEVLDNRAGATNPVPTLLSWKLNLVLSDKLSSPLPLNNGVAQSNTVPPGSIVYYAVNVPSWATAATNILVSASGPVNLLFNQSVLPTGTNSGDYALMTSQTSGSATLLTAGTTPLLQPGQTYYLGVQNTGTTPVNFTLEVFFNITPLVNRVPVIRTVQNDPLYFEYTVSTNNPLMTTFEILHSTGNVELVARQGLPLPNTNSFDYLTAVPGTGQQEIIVLTNSTPVALSPGTWYLGVVNNDFNSVSFSIEAAEVDQADITITPLVDGVPYVTNTLHTTVMTNFYSFNITNDVPAVLFELYNITNGNVDLTLQRGTYPFGPPYFAGSFNSGTNREQIVLRTNLLGTNLLGMWYLGVPNNTAGNVNFTILAETSSATNGFLQSGVPFKMTPVAPPTGSSYGLTLTWPGVTGNYYEIQSRTNLVLGSWTNYATVVADGDVVSYTDPTPITNAPVQYYRIVPLATP